MKISMIFVSDIVSDIYAKDIFLFNATIVCEWGLHNNSAMFQSFSSSLSDFLDKLKPSN